ncbi:hypothetical protein HU200_028526 [Digitaria exilis]|uniref:VWFA domain-containing protein n=1 Tax=Digitaria exilis TaxID=1010633 RepID=A0A835C5Q9_9POAL|nr:hypothetical protein HU200_028526 [Digitaria exilis]
MAVFGWLLCCWGADGPPATAAEQPAGCSRTLPIFPAYNRNPAATLDLVAVVDVSASMAAAGPTTNKLEETKSAMALVLDTLGSAPATASASSPSLTTPIATAKLTVESLVAGEGSTSTTNIRAGHEEDVAGVILLSDGYDDHSACRRRERVWIEVNCKCQYYPEIGVAGVMRHGVSVGELYADEERRGSSSSFFDVESVSDANYPSRAHYLDVATTGQYVTVEPGEVQRPVAAVHRVAAAGDVAQADAAIERGDYDAEATRILAARRESLTAVSGSDTAFEVLVAELGELGKFGRASFLASSVTRRCGSRGLALPAAAGKQFGWAAGVGVVGDAFGTPHKNGSSKVAAPSSSFTAGGKAASGGTSSSQHVEEIPARALYHASS